MMDTPDRVEKMATWHDQEAANLRAHHATMASMPELAEMHEETAAMLRRLHAQAVKAEWERDESQGYVDAVNREAGKLLVKHDDMKIALATARPDALREAAKMVKTTRYKCEFYPVGRSRGVPMLAPTQFKEQAVEAILALIPPPTTSTGET
jgi:hypothetical protein